MNDMFFEGGMARTFNFVLKHVPTNILNAMMGWMGEKSEGILHLRTFTHKTAHGKYAKQLKEERLKAKLAKEQEEAAEGGNNLPVIVASTTPTYTPSYRLTHIMRTMVSLFDEGNNVLDALQRGDQIREISQVSMRRIDPFLFDITDVGGYYFGIGGSVTMNVMEANNCNATEECMQWCVTYKTHTMISVAKAHESLKNIYNTFYDESSGTCDLIYVHTYFSYHFHNILLFSCFKSSL